MNILWPHTITIFYFPVALIPTSHPLFPAFSNKVKDDDRALSLGSLTIPLTRLLATPELTMDQWFQLDNSGSASRIYAKIVLRVGSSLINLM